MSPEHPTAGRGKDGVGATVVAPPGTVDTPFRDKRGGTPEAAPAMTAEHIADTIVFVVNQPAGVDINHITMRPARAGRLTPGTQRPYEGTPLTPAARWHAVRTEGAVARQPGDARVPRGSGYGRNGDGPGSQGPTPSCVTPTPASAVEPQRRTRGIPRPIQEMISRWISLLPPPNVKITADR